MQIVTLNYNITHNCCPLYTVVVITVMIGVMIITTHLY